MEGIRAGKDIGRCKGCQIEALHTASTREPDAKRLKDPEQRGWGGGPGPPAEAPCHCADRQVPKRFRWIGKRGTGDQLKSVSSLGRAEAPCEPGSGRPRASCRVRDRCSPGRRGLGHSPSLRRRASSWWSKRWGRPMNKGNRPDRTGGSDGESSAPGYGSAPASGHAPGQPSSPGNTRLRWFPRESDCPGSGDSS